LELVGKERTAEEVTEEVLRDAPFYRRSGGGACLSGGEPLMQAEFAVEFLRLCQSRLISTSVETCCHVNPEVLREVSAYADYMLTDIKHMDSARHREGTGVSNELILDNIAMLAAAGKKIRVRLPLIPGFNDSEENLKETAKFMKEHHIRYIDLLPFHATGGFKYDRLGMEYAYAEHRTPSSEEMSEYMALFERVGVGGTIGGTDIEPF
jgi:pyruvate formate lyase activating enzyme